MVKRIALVISSLEQGGAQRAITYLANYLSNHDYIIDMVTFDPETTSPFFSLNKNITIHKLNLLKESYDVLRKIRVLFSNTKILRNTIKKISPDLVISFLDSTNIKSLIATTGLGIPVIVCERTDLSMHKVSSIMPVLRKLLYPLSDAIIVQTADAKKYLGQNNDKIHIIPNVIEVPSRISPPPMQNRFFTIGRLCKNKGLDVLVKAFEKANIPNWHLDIYGEGDFRSSIEQLRVKYVNLKGSTSDVWTTLAEGGIYVFASLYEGYPNSCIEALAAGLPVISSNCNGCKDVIINNKNGILVQAGNVDQLCAAMIELTSNKDKLREIQSHSAEVITAHSPDKIYPLWLQVIHHCIP